MLQATRYFVKKYHIRHIFLATEDEDNYLKFQQAFPEKLIAIEQKRVRYDAEKNPDASVADLLALKDGREFGRTYLAVLYALGKCRYLIASMYCGATMGAFAFTERGFDRYELINDQSLLRLQMEEAEQDAGHPIIFMQMHQSVKGWTKWKSEMEDVSSGGGIRTIEALRFRFSSGDAVIRYATFHPKDGWSHSSVGGEISGTTGKSRPIYGIRLAAEHFARHLAYRVRFSASGWSDWVMEGTPLYSKETPLVDVDIRTE